MTQNQILDIFGVSSNGQNRVLRDDEEVLSVIKNAYELARRFNEIYKDDSDSEWIPASDEHPNKNGSYLVQVCVYDKTAAFEYISVDHANDDGTWLHEDAHHKIVAWMPLPEPYKAESEDKK